MKEFGATTPQLESMSEWLKERNVESVAMESTGVWAQELKAHYWIAPHEVLERNGFEVLLVNTRDLANVLSTLAPVDTTSAQLRAADGFVPAAGTGLHGAHIGSRQKDQCAFKLLHR